MRQIVFSLLVFFLSPLVFGNEEHDDPGFRYFTPSDRERAQNGTTVYSVQFGTGGTGGPGTYFVSFLSFTDTGCTTSAFSTFTVGGATTPSSGVTYSLSGTGLYSYYIGNGKSTSQVASVQSFQLQDRLHLGTVGACITLTCTTLDCSYASGTVGTLTLNQ